MSRSAAWRRWLTDGTAIVVSILLAFAIDAGWDRIQADREESQNLVALAEDFRANLELLRERRQRIEVSIDRLIRLRDTLRTARPDARVELPNAVALELRRAGTIDLVRGTLDAMVSSGRLAQLSDQSLRAALTAWPRLVDDVRTDQLESLRFVRHDMVPFLATQGDYASLLYAGPDEESGATVFRAKPAMITMVSGRLYMAQVTLLNIDPLIVMTADILDLLERATAA